MSGIRDSLGRAGHDLLARALAACGREEFTGGLRVSGSPGGTFHLRGGLVVAVESPGAPGPEALLLRSGRIGGEQWADLVRESGGSRWPLDGLIAHGYAGAAQLRIVCVLALHDAAFAVVAGDVDDCELAPDERPFAPVMLGEPSVRLFQDAVRKFAAITALPYPVRPDRERPRPRGTPSTRPDSGCCSGSCSPMRTVGVPPAISRSVPGARCTPSPPRWRGCSPRACWSARTHPCRSRCGCRPADSP